MSASPTPSSDDRRFDNERGVTSIEYSFMAGLIAVVIVGTVTLIGIGVASLFSLVPPGV